MKVLVADTNSELLEHVRFIFSRLQPDWQLQIVDSGRQCLDILRNACKPDIVLIGIQLPDMPGFELTRCIRDDSDIPVILLSEDKNIELLVEAFETGANDYIVEPYHNAVFIARIKAAVRRRTWDIRRTEDRAADYEFSWGGKG
jgi:two-component system response regulator MtrA